MYMTVKQAAEKWGISDRRVRKSLLSIPIIQMQWKEIH